MSDSSSFTSLYDLVNSHLSKCSIYETNSNNTSNTSPNCLKSSSLNGVKQGLSDTHLISEKRLDIPKCSISDSPIQKVLAEQINNMLKRKQDEEEKQSREKKDKLQLKEDRKDDYVIDLMQAIQTPIIRPKPVEEVLSRSNSFESLLRENTKYFDEQCVSPGKNKSPIEEPYPESLQCVTDISYILNQKVDKAKCSNFGKVLTAKMKQVPAPYLKINIENNEIVRFDFNTKSPCDLILERLRQPSCYNPNYVSIMDIIMSNP